MLDNLPHDISSTRSGSCTALFDTKGVLMSNLGIDSIRQISLINQKSYIVQIKRGIVGMARIYEAEKRRTEIDK